MNNNFIIEKNKLTLINKRRTEKEVSIKKDDFVFLYRKKQKNSYPEIGEIGDKFKVINIDSYHNIWVLRIKDNATFKHPIHKDYFCKSNELRDTKLDSILNSL